MIREAARDGYSIYLLGGTAEVVKETAEILQKSFPVLNIAGYHHGYYPGGKESEICSQIRDSGANMLFIGMPTPYKEDFMRRYFEKTGALFCMGVGGSFDIVSGKTKRAPVFMQKTGLEWLFRVFQEPGRLWKRYFVSNLLFALILLEKKIKSLWRKDGRLPG
jgi:N-acetylglucosaminyldiphosphoundecaprenol N-acetyl-beta-D-mannosaminyltransferase